jgi:exopolyphosphatase/guanosine-5'-triphosphate,3'-diphosphate pyrophosphatase
MNDADIARVGELLGRIPQGQFEIVVRTKSGDPVVLRNAPFLDDGTPMPTRYWLLGEHETVIVGRLEASGGVNQAEADIGPTALIETHERYAAERDAAIDPAHTGPRPFGGVGGTRIGVKCLHAHFGWWLAVGNDPVGQWVADKLDISRDDYVVAENSAVINKRSRPVFTSPVAAIDIGTNSTNLLIVDPQGNEIVREVNVTRLGKGVAASGRLEDSAIAATVQQLAIYASLLKQHNVETFRVTATEACRRASNANTFLDQAEATLGKRPEIISGEAEGKLAFSGALSKLDPHDGTTIVIDIGGGSTEIMIGTGNSLQHVSSFPVGAVVLSETELHRDPPRPEELTNAIGLVTDFMDDLVREFPQVLNATRVVGVAGTIVTIAAIELGIARFDPVALHDMTLTREAAEDVFRTLATESLIDRKSNPGLPPERADVIVGGCCALVGIMRRLRIPSITVSVHNLLDGVVQHILDPQ